ncbi:MAG: hypothetical protein ACUVQY_10305 [Thermoproteota archaeon]
MPRGVAKGRKLIAVPSGLVDELCELANRDGVPFYNYTANALEEVVKAGRMRRSLRDVLEFYEVMEVRKASGYVLVPRDALRRLIKKLWSREGDSLRDMWLDAGRWFGRFLMAKFGRQSFDFFIKVLKRSEWEIGEVSLEEKSGIVRLRLASLTLPEEDTELLLNYVEGAMESLGIEIANKDCMKGIINLELKKAYG